MSVYLGALMTEHRHATLCFACGMIPYILYEKIRSATHYTVKCVNKDCAIYRIREIEAQNNPVVITAATAVGHVQALKIYEDNNCLGYLEDGN